MNKKKFVKEFCKLNKCTEDDIIYRMDGRVEWVCEDGIGHTIYSLDNNFVHGCDGCCSKLKFPKE
jgi:hypothetical protein